MASIIQMAGNCSGSQPPSQPTQNQKREIRVSWIKSSSSPDVRRAMDHVLENTPEADKTAVRDAVKAMEATARAIYKDDRFNPLPQNGDEFVRIMMEQGCFILLVALRSLGALKDLRLNWTKQQIRTWVLDLFDIRNQIPLVVIQELTNYKFFDDALKSVKNERPNDLPRKVFYDHLVKPKLDSPGSQVNLMKRLFSCVSGRGLSHEEPSPPTLLHALWVLLTGPASGGADDKRFFSCLSSRCLSHQKPSSPTPTGSSSSTGGTANNNAIVEDNSSNIDIDDDDENDCAWFTVRSATELKEKIIFKSNKEKGTRGIKFEDNMFDAHLYLPPITIESDTEKLFKHLIDYEEEIGLNRNQREVCSYLKLMSELVRTSEDARILAMHGIINAHPKQEENLPQMLKKLPLPEVLGNDKNHQDVRSKIRSYVKPSKWKMVRDLIVIGLVISVFSLFVTQLQTVYTILAYYQGNNNKNSA